MYSSTSAEATHTDAAVAQSVERRIGSAEVTGPIPVSSLWIAWYLPGFFSFCAALVYTYETVNGAEEPVARVTCPYCGREFTTDMDFMW